MKDPKIEEILRTADAVALLLEKTDRLAEYFARKQHGGKVKD